ncbi:hypothetical protein [Hymenobacter properus]|uniref:Uncharacterized protein n=1 Tax=Hymenobacter properus TaxID=2791026 RepID=A0A931BCM4_9BACT|nr:hypothetical protein [Hymenobacter properus]MBF9140151.1 hypothetical protein [Hymenobacter properus]MBR7718958.1 hypothetical protein [Microvirga sp. SRT04]
MKRKNRQEPYLKILTSNWVTFPLILILGFAGGFISAGYGWAKSGYQFLPSEIIIKPPPPNVIACFPDMGFVGALKFQKELSVQMQKKHLQQFNDLVVQSSIDSCLANSGKGFSLQLLHASPKHFQVISSSTGGLAPYSRHTLITESGCYYLHPIPKRRSGDYNSLIQLRWKEQAKL